MLTRNTITPFEYQNDCLIELRKAKAEGAKSALVVMASGLGKTITVALYALEWFMTKKEARCLFLCHQNDILVQAQLEFQKVFGDSVKYGFFHGEEKSQREADIVFGSFQSMRESLDQFHPEEFDLVIVDETHHSKAPTYEAVVLNWQPEFMIAITATPDRYDGKDIREIYGKEIYNLPLVDALARGLLCPVRYKLMTDEILLKGSMETPHGRMNIKLLNKLVFVPRRDKEIADIIKRHMAEVENPRVMVFCSSIAHCENMAAALGDAVPIHSGVPSTEKRMRLEMFRQGVVPVAVTVDMFNEALDIPEANIIVFLRSTDSPTIYFQQLGRGLRPHEDKSEVIILDFVANCERIALVLELWKQVKVKRGDMFDGMSRLSPGRGPGMEPFHLNVDTVEFEEKIVPLLELIDRLKAGFYPTWKEAGEGAIRLKVLNERGYATAYKQDHRLPSNPRQYYSDFPGWTLFLGTDHYASWKEASASAIALRIIYPEEYRKRYTEDRHLPSSPNKEYADFPGWTIFLGRKVKEYYSTWQEASTAAMALEIKNQTQYYKRHNEDPKLTSTPHRRYSDFPGYSKFLGKE